MSRTHRRRGSALVFVLTATMLVATAGIATLVLQREEMATATLTQDAQRAEQRAMEILQLGGQVLRKDPYGLLYRPLRSDARQSLLVTIDSPQEWLKIEAVPAIAGSEPTTTSDVRVTASATVGETTRTYSYIARPILRDQSPRRWRSAIQEPSDPDFGASVPQLLRHGLIAGGCTVSGTTVAANTPERIRGETAFESSFLAVAPRDNNASNSYYSQVPLVKLGTAAAPVRQFEQCLPHGGTAIAITQPRTWLELSDVLYGSGSASTDPKFNIEETQTTTFETWSAGGGGQIARDGGNGGMNIVRGGAAGRWIIPGMGDVVCPSASLMSTLAGRHGSIPSTYTIDTTALVGEGTEVWRMVIAPRSGSFSLPGGGTGIQLSGEFAARTSDSVVDDDDIVLYANNSAGAVAANLRDAAIVGVTSATTTTRLAWLRTRASLIIPNDAEIAGPVSMDPPATETGVVLPTLIVQGTLTVTRTASGEDLRESTAVDADPRLDRGLNRLEGYFGACDDDAEDVMPARLRGVVYVTGDLVIQAGAALTVEGVLWVGGTVKILGSSSVLSPRGQLTVRYQPPAGPVLGAEEVTGMQIVGGSFRRQVSP